MKLGSFDFSITSLHFSRLLSIGDVQVSPQWPGLRCAELPATLLFLRVFGSFPHNWPGGLVVGRTSWEPNCPLPRHLKIHVKRSKVGKDSGILVFRALRPQSANEISYQIYAEKFRCLCGNNSELCRKLAPACNASCQAASKRTPLPLQATSNSILIKSCSARGRSVLLQKKLQNKTIKTNKQT